MQEITIDYSDCAAQAPFPPSQGDISHKVKSTFKSSKVVTRPYWQKTVSKKLPGPDKSTTTCHLYFEIPDSIGPPVYMYYRLTNFYQNHRRYVQSLDLSQLSGDAVSITAMEKSKCDPLRTDPASGKPYYPCGLIANSQFNDSISSPVQLTSHTNTTYEMSRKGIAWSSDKELFQTTKYTPDQVVPPPNWHDRYPYGYNEQYPIPDLHNDEDFMVWMRTAGLPDFSKLSKKNEDAPMTAGIYRLDIDDCMSDTNALTWSPAKLALRFSCYGVQWYQVNSHIYSDCYWWQEPFHGDCLRYCRGYLHCSWSTFHGCLLS